MYLSRLFNWPLIKPRTITITLTAKCNLRCIMCDHWRAKSVEPSLNEVKKYIDQIVKWGIEEIDLSGGEPFCYKDIWKVIEYATKNRLKMNITTNASLFSLKQLDKILDSTVSRLQISIDGKDSETHDKIRGVKGTFDKALKAVEYLHKKRIQRKTPLLLNITTVILRHNVNQLVEIYKLAKKKGFDSLTFQPVNDSNLEIGRKKAYNPLRIQEKQLPVLDEQIDRLITIRKKDHFIGNTISYLKSIKTFFRGEKVRALKCYAGFVVGIISPEGRFWTCKGDYGNLIRHNIKKTWYSSAASKKRRLIRKCKYSCMYPCYLEGDADNLIEATKKVFRE